MRGSNPRPWAHKTHALPTELTELDAIIMNLNKDQIFFNCLEMRYPGIEPGAIAWKATMLPLHQYR